MRNSPNVIKEVSVPTNRIASPITTGFSPAQGGSLDDYRNGIEDGRPADPLGQLPTDRDSKKSRR